MKPLKPTTDFIKTSIAVRNDGGVENRSWGAMPTPAIYRHYLLPENAKNLHTLIIINTQWDYVMDTLLCKEIWQPLGSNIRRYEIQTQYVQDGVDEYVLVNLDGSFKVTLSELLKS